MIDKNHFLHPAIPALKTAINAAKLRYQQTGEGIDDIEELEDELKQLEEEQKGEPISDQ